MDEMDIDQVVEVPDTPDRFAKQGINGRSGVKVDNGTSSSPFHGQQKIFEEGSRDQPMIIDSGSRVRSLHPPKRTSSPSNSHHLTTSASFSSPSSSSSRNTHIFRKGVSEKSPRYPNHESMHKKHLQSMRPPYTAKSSSSPNDGFLDLTERNLPKPVIGNDSLGKVPGNNQGDFQRRLGLGNGTSSHSQTNFQIAPSSTIEGTGRVGSSTAYREGVDFVGNGNKKPGNGGFLSLDSIASPRVSKQKRLVRNGCISPNNIAKAKHVTAKDINGSLAVAHNNVSVAVGHNNGSVASSAPPIPIDIRELVAEDSDSHTRKGKGVISRPCSSKEPDLHNRITKLKLSSEWSSMSFNDKAMEMIDFSRATSRSIEESGGWRNTRHRIREIRMPSPDKEHHSIREREASRNPTQHHENRLERKQKEISVASSGNYFKDPNFTSSEHVAPLRESVSHPRGRLGRLNGPRSVADSLMKRQKQGSTSSSRGECSTLVSADPEVVFLSSAAETGHSKSTSSNVDNLQQIIEVDELSPQLRRNDHDEDTRERQVEADELLARELQEQFYNEVPVFGEVDEHLALALQHQEGSNYGPPRARRPVSDARLMPHLVRQSPSRSSSNAPRRGALARSSILGRTTRLRSRFPGQARTLLPSRGRTSIFPREMDVDMRMHILGALEEFSDMGVSPRILQPDRDFNEDDYEMLLALDENNHHHGGATIHQINGLPQSTVQSDNFEEVCAVCLDTPTIGDTIRHLPCLHKFHKDCIDPWLRRRTSCPVCKSSIT